MCEDYILRKTNFCVKEAMMLGRVVLWSALGFFLCSCAPQETQNFASAPRRSLSPRERDIVVQAIQAELKDPNSAMVDFLPMPIARSQVISYCALVNAKNALGGYVGRMPAEIAVKTSESGEIVAAKLAGISSGVNSEGVDPWLWRCQTLGYIAS